MKLRYGWRALITLLLILNFLAVSFIVWLVLVRTWRILEWWDVLFSIDTVIVAFSIMIMAFWLWKDEAILESLELKVTPSEMRRLKNEIQEIREKLKHLKERKNVKI